MTIDPINSDPNDWEKALENFFATGELSIPLPLKWQRIIQLKNDYPDMNDKEIAARVGYTNKQSVANTVQKIKRFEIEHGKQLLNSSRHIIPYRNELELIKKYLPNPENLEHELAYVLFTVYHAAQNKLPFKTCAMRIGWTTTKFNAVWSELNEVGFQEDGTIWLGMQLPQTVRDFTPPNHYGAGNVLSYLVWLANHPDQLPPNKVNTDYATDSLVEGMAAIAISRAKRGEFDVLNSFKHYDIPQEHRNKENTERAIRTLVAHFFLEKVLDI